MRIAMAPLLLSVLVAACGKKNDEPAASAPIAIGKIGRAPDTAPISGLLPKNTAQVIRIASADRLVKILDLFEFERMGDPLENLTELVGVDDSAVDRTRPIFVALEFVAADKPPVPTVIVALKDPAKETTVAEGVRMSTAGDYVGFSRSEGYEVGQSDFADGMPAGDVSTRVDLARLIETYRDRIEEALKFELPGSAAGLGMLDKFTDLAKELLAVSESFDATLSVNDGAVDFQFTYTTSRTQQKDAASLSELGKHVPPDFAVVALFQFRLAGLNELFMPFFDDMIERLPPERRAAMKEHVDKQNALSELLSDEWMMAADFDEGGYRVAMIVRAEEAERYATGYADLMSAPAAADVGMKVSDKGSRSIGDVTVRRMRMAFDFQKLMEIAGEDTAGQGAMSQMAMGALFGKDGLLTEVAARDGFVFITAGGAGTQMERLLRADRMPPELKQAADQIGDGYQLLLQVDVRRVMKGVSALMSSFMPGFPAPKYPAGPPLPVTVYGRDDGRVVRGGVTLDVGKIKAFFQAGTRR